LIITLAESGENDDTNDQGIFRLPLPAGLRPGVLLKVSIAKPGWRIRYPLEGEIRVPSRPAEGLIPQKRLALLRRGSLRNGWHL